MPISIGRGESELAIAHAQARAYRKYFQIDRAEMASMTLERHQTLKAERDKIEQLPHSSVLYDHETKLTHVIIDDSADQIVAVYELNQQDQCVLLDRVPASARAHWEFGKIEPGIDEIDAEPKDLLSSNDIA